MTMRGRAGLIALWSLVLLGAPGRAHLAPERSDTSPPTVTGPQEVEVIAVLIDQRTQQPTVVLEGKRDKRSLAMVIGLAEATGIAVPLQGATPPRPLTHDLFLTLFGRLKVALTRVVVTDLRDDIYYATIYLAAGGGEMQLDARPSDAIALAIRAKAPVFVEDRVFEKTGARLPRGGPSI
jgi:bifunctional DNase/RNase